MRARIATPVMVIATALAAGLAGCRTLDVTVTDHATGAPVSGPRVNVACPGDVLVGPTSTEGKLDDKGAHHGSMTNVLPFTKFGDTLRVTVGATNDWLLRRRNTPNDADLPRGAKWANYAWFECPMPKSGERVQAVFGGFACDNQPMEKISQEFFRSIDVWVERK